jgi:exopolyphosphatase/guanosine-5'-triphosphate,3'-diphosphate pyrophosphatase
MAEGTTATRWTVPDAPGRAAPWMGSSPRVAIIDIGSNSIRLVVYQGLSRAPEVLLNEKVMAGLGRGLAENGALSAESMEVAIQALGRFARLADAMEVDSLRAVATAAVREAVNGGLFMSRVRAETGLAIEVLDGESEARAAALGVIAGIPDADGVVGDLGGGSLELVRVGGGEPRERLSLPLGVLRLDAARKKNRRALARLVEEGLESVNWVRLGRGRPFYAVGGSWRALAQLHMHLIDWPLPVIHHHVMTPDVPARLVRTLAGLPTKSLREIPNLSAARVPYLPGAAFLLRIVTERLQSSAIIASAFGLREGLIFGALPAESRSEDPLISAARAEAHRSGRFSDGSDVAIGDSLLSWTDPLFPDEPEAVRRVRHAACLLADVAWRAHPDMRAERGLDVALHGNWVGIDAPGRALLATALWAVNGGGPLDPALARLVRVAPPQDLLRARQWGLALRLGQRLGGGTVAGLEGTSIEKAGGRLTLRLAGQAAALSGGEAVSRRLRLLADLLGLQPEILLSR